MYTYNYPFFPDTKCSFEKKVVKKSSILIDFNKNEMAQLQKAVCNMFHRQKYRLV